MSTSSAYQPWWPSHGSVACLSTIPIIAITIVGRSTRKPQKMNACISPGPRRWSSLRWPSTIVASLLDPPRACRRRADAGCACLASRTSRRGAADEQRAADRQSDGQRDRGDRRGYAPFAFRISARDRGHDLVQVADHGVVGAGEDRRLAVGVDRQQLLGALAAGHVLGRAADPARDVERRARSSCRSARPGRCAVASRRWSRRASSRRRRPSSCGQLLDHREALGRADAAPAGDDDVRVGERHAGGGRSRRARTLDARLAAAGRARPRALSVRRDGVRRDGRSAGEPCSRASSSRLPPQRTRVSVSRVARRQRHAVGGHRQIEPRGDVREDLVAAVGARARRRRSGDRCAIRSTSALAARRRARSRAGDRRPRPRRRSIACANVIRLQRELVVWRLGEHQEHLQHAPAREDLDDRGRRLRPVAEDLRPACPIPAGA